MLRRCSIPVRTLVEDRELQKKEILPVQHLCLGSLAYYSTLSSSVRHFAFSKERELGPNDTQRGCSENVE